MRKLLIPLLFFATAVVVATASPTIAAAHIPEITATCNTLTAHLTNYEQPQSATRKNNVLKIKDTSTDNVWHSYGFTTSYDNAWPLNPNIAHHIIIEIDANLTYGEPAASKYDVRMIRDIVPCPQGPSPTVTAYGSCERGVTWIADNVPTPATVTVTVDGHDILHLEPYDETTRQGRFETDQRIAHTWSVAIDAPGTTYDVRLTGSYGSCPLEVPQTPTPQPVSLAPPPPALITELPATL